MGFFPAACFPQLFTRIENNPQGTGLWREILKHAMMCPSVHNIQPWRVKIESDTRAVVYYNSSLALAYADRSSAFMTITMAMFVEMISLVASLEGYEVHVTFEPHEALKANAGLTLFAGLELKQTGVAPRTSLQEVYGRRTARFGYTSEPVADSILVSLGAEAAAFGIKCGFVTEPKTVSDIRCLCVETLFEDLYNNEYRGELGTWIRTSGSDKITGDGLSAVCMGQPDGITHRFFTYPQRFQSGFKKHLLKHHFKQSLHNTHTMLWLNHSFGAYTDWIDCGKGLLHLWLALTKAGIYMQPFGNLVTNMDAHKKLETDILKQTGNVWFIARIGHCKMPPASVRKPLQTILI
ncbi:MAG: hypothetical protein JST26_11485 [Bacteroidetes bacterium]|nr:hypothetical protein [Bacteroidota bacterium]